MAGQQQHRTLETRRCPDDETVAAYLDRRLSTADAACVVTHMAACGTCVELLAAIAAGLDPIETSRSRGAGPCSAVAAALRPESSCRPN